MLTRGSAENPDTNRTSVVMVSRLMLNIQNPALFGNCYGRTRGGQSGATNGMNLFFTASGTLSRRRRMTEIAFAPMQSDVDENMGDPAWHRETHVASQTSDTTDASDATDASAGN